MTARTLLSDVVLPAATWYEKHDLSSTDMHPFVHAFTPAIDPPWETRTDFDAFHGDRPAVQRPGAASTSASAGTSSRRRCSTTPPARPPQPGGVVRDWRAGEVEPVPGRTMPAFTVVERDYGAVADKMAALGPARRAARADHQGRDRSRPTRRWRLARQSTA